MQRALVIVSLVFLVLASLGVGALTAHWPFWRRAWTWHAAAANWPHELPGPHAIVRGAEGVPLRFAAASFDLTQAAGNARTSALLRVRSGHAEAWFAPGNNEHMRVDGHGLTTLVLAPLFDQLAASHPGLLDQPVGAWLPTWRQDARGAIVPRELLARVGAGIATPPAFAVFNPFSARAQLASGPDFTAAALSVFDPADTASAAQQMSAAQLLATVAAAAGGTPFALALERELWSRVAVADASVLLDRRHGTAAAHCCLTATAADWVRLGLRLADSGTRTTGVQVYRSTGRILAVGSGPAALLWVGEGEPPPGLETLLTGI
jgi:hypothetical protein